MLKVRLKLSLQHHKFHEPKSKEAEGLYPVMEAGRLHLKILDASSPSQENFLCLFTGINWNAVQQMLCHWLPTRS